MVQFGLVCRQESDYFQNALQENSNNTNTAEVDHLKQKIAQLTLDINALKIENSSLKVDKENLSKERKNDAKQIKRLENERKSLENKEKAVKYLREKYEMNKISDQFSQKMSTRSTQHRIQTQNKIPSNKPGPFKTPSVKSEARSELNEPTSFMRDDEEDEILASPQASQDSPLLGDDLSRVLNSDTQQSAAFSTPAAEMGDTWSD